MALPQGPIILSSGYSQEEATKRFGGKGLAGFLRKPSELARRLDKLREVLK